MRKARRSKRTDPHRPGAIVPGEYEHVLSYNGASSQGGIPMPSFGINCELDGRREYRDEDGKVRHVNGKHAVDGRCCVVKLSETCNIVGNTGVCGICGTAFVYGEIWHHTPTGEHINVGHICGAKYGLLVDRSAFELAADRARAAAARQVQEKLNHEARQAVLDANPGLGEALATDHYIVKDIANRFHRYCRLSDKQISLVFKLAAEADDVRVCERCAGDHELDRCPTRGTLPTGRQEIELLVLATKWQENDFGGSLKMLGLHEETGCKVWCTAPGSIGGEHRHCVVKIRVTLSQSQNDPHFYYGSRPYAKTV